jgi:CheY-like chemotaxis protein
MRDPAPVDRRTPIQLQAVRGLSAAAARLVGGAPAEFQARRRVLVVEDHRDSADSLCVLLELMGHEVRAAHDGPEGEAAAVAWRPEIVVSDIGLPGFDGYELARRLRRTSELGPLLLVALTGYGREEDRRQSREAGFDLHLTKPADPDVLRRVLAGTSEGPETDE